MHCFLEQPQYYHHAPPHRIPGGQEPRASQTILLHSAGIFRGRPHALNLTALRNNDCVEGDNSGNHTRWTKHKVRQIFSHRVRKRSCEWLAM